MGSLEIPRGSFYFFCAQKLKRKILVSDHITLLGYLPQLLYRAIQSKSPKEKIQYDTKIFLFQK